MSYSYGGYGYGHNGNQYGGQGNFNAYNHQEGQLSHAQYQKAQQYAQPGNSLDQLLNQPNNNRVAEAVNHRAIQEILRNNHNFVDNSTAGNNAFRNNCHVVHNPVTKTHNYNNEPARQNPF
jgi:hypothetical protein